MTVFCASVNDENFLVDPTGNTRFWTIPVASIDYLHIVDMQQLFAQLLIDIQSGAQWWLTQEEDELLELQNRKHRAVSALRERVLGLIDTDAVDAMRSGRVFTPPPAAMTCIDFLAKVGIESATNAQCQECGAILRELLGDPKKIRGLMKWRIPIRPPEDLGNHRGQKLSHARGLQAQINADDNNDF